MVSEGAINESFFADAVIIKNETPILSPTSGKLQLLVKTGERVRVGTPLFIITTDEKQKELYRKEINEIEAKLGNLQDGAESSSLSLNIINKSIENTTKKIKDASDGGEFDKVKLLNDELSRLTQEKQKKMEANENNISLLNKQIEKLKERLNEIDVVVYAPVAGIVSLNIDELEDLLVADKIKNITYEQLQAINTDTGKKNLPTQIEANQPVVKIIDNFSWYIALKPERQLEEGRSYYISLGDSDEKIKAKLTNIQGDASLGVFLINRDLEGFLDSRKIRVEVVTGTYTGYKIPATALVLNEEGEGVYIIERGKRLFKPVEIVTQNENDIIVTGLKLGDKILLNKRRSIWFD